MAAQTLYDGTGSPVNPNELIPSLRITYKHLAFRANNPDRVCYEGYEKIADALGISLSQFYRRLCDLVALGCVVVHKRPKMRPVIQPLFYLPAMRTKCEKSANPCVRAYKDSKSKEESMKERQQTPPSAEPVPAEVSVVVSQATPCRESMPQKPGPTGTDVQSHSQTARQDFEIEKSGPIIGNLIAEGIAASYAAKIVQAVTIARARELLRWLKAYKARHAVPNPTGLLRRAVEGDWQLGVTEGQGEANAGYHVATAEELAAKREALRCLAWQVAPPLAQIRARLKEDVSASGCYT